MITPILILTRDNPEYLYVTLKSLSATEINDNPIIIIDNCSSFQFTKNFYETYDTFDVTFNDWTTEGKSSQEKADKEYAKTFLTIPQITQIQGIKRKFQVISTPRILKPIKIIQFALKAAFKIFPKANKCCILDDNILFNKHWLNEAEFIFESSKKPRNNVGIVSVYSEEPAIPEFRYKIDAQAFRGKMMLVNRELYQKMFIKGYFDKGAEFFGNEPNFVEFERICYQMGFITVVSGPSFIQSLEKRNLSTKNNMLKYQDNFKRPISWNDSML